MPIVALGALSLMTSCIMEDLPECEAPVRLHFTYLHSRENDADPDSVIDLFRAEVPNVVLTAYDEDTGVPVDSIDVTREQLGERQEFVWRLPRGRYNVVSWGGVYGRHVVKTGTDFGGHRMRIAGDTVGQMEEHVWHHCLPGMTVDADSTRTYQVDLHKLTNNILVRVVSTNGALLEYPTRASISVTDGEYDGQRNMTAVTPTLYLPDTKFAADSLIHEHFFTTLRLHCNDDSHLSVTYGESGEVRRQSDKLRGEDAGNVESIKIYDGPLSSLLAQRPYADLDLDDEWELEFGIEPGPPGAISVTVSVNGWTIRRYDVSLQ